MSEYTGQKNEILSFHYALTSASTMSRGIDVSNCDKVTFIVSAGSTLNSTVYLGNIYSTITILQGADATITTAGGLATASLFSNIGSTATSYIDNAESIIIRFSSGKNGGNEAETIVINGVTFTVAATMAANGTNYNSTFGIRSSLISTNTTDGPGFLANGLAALLNSTLGSSIYNGGFGAVFAASTPATGVMRLDVKDWSQASSGITIACGTGFSPSILAAQAKIEFPTAMLNSTSKYVGIQLTTVTTNIPCHITCIKQGVRYHPSFAGKSKIAT